MGFQYLLNGIDYLLFLLCLVVPFRTPAPAPRDRRSVRRGALHHLRRLGVWHGAWCVVVSAARHHAGRDLDPLRGGRQRDWNWQSSRPGASAFSPSMDAAFAFGLVHGFAFSFALGQTLQFAGSHVITAVLSFNAGIETRTTARSSFS